MLLQYNSNKNDRFLCPPWQKVQLESKELMAACLRKIPGLSKVKLIGDKIRLLETSGQINMKKSTTFESIILISGQSFLRVNYHTGFDNFEIRHYGVINLLV